ncbi:unnamed protein product [Rhodiola kirilowii]
MASESTPSVDSVNCDSCGFTEDCTAAYISLVRDRYQGRWICGLCAEAVKDEVRRSGKTISTEEALNRHISVCKEFRSSSPPASPISEIARILRKSLDTPRAAALRSKSSNALPDVAKIKAAALYRSESCFLSLSR